MDPPEVLYPGVDKGAMQNMRGKCGEEGRGGNCATPVYKLGRDRGVGGDRLWGGSDVVKDVTMG